MLVYSNCQKNVLLTAAENGSSDKLETKDPDESQAVSSPQSHTQETSHSGEGWRRQSMYCLNFTKE